MAQPTGIRSPTCVVRQCMCSRHFSSVCRCGWGTPGGETLSASANWPLTLRPPIGSGRPRTVVENCGWARLWGQSRGECLANFTLGYVIV